MVVRTYISLRWRGERKYGFIEDVHIPHWRILWHSWCLQYGRECLSGPPGLSRALLCWEQVVGLRSSVYCHRFDHYPCLQEVWVFVCVCVWRGYSFVPRFIPQAIITCSMKRGCFSTAIEPGNEARGGGGLQPVMEEYLNHVPPPPPTHTHTHTHTHNGVSKARPGRA